MKMRILITAILLGQALFAPALALGQDQATQAAPAPLSALSANSSVQPQAGPMPTGPQGDIRDIRGPIHIPDPWAWVGYAGAGLLGLVLIAGLILMIARARKEKEKMAYELAFEQLEKARALMAEEKAREFSFAVSGILREYIEQRFKVRAVHHSTEEFMRNLAQDTTGHMAGHVDLLDDFLIHCDLAKFARYRLSLDQMEQLYKSAWHFVHQTRPQENVSGKKSKKATNPVLTSGATGPMDAAATEHGNVMATGG